ncbi:MAG: hypothetical protein WC749_10355 [Dehalococcoidia bacterium]
MDRLLTDEQIQGIAGLANDRRRLVKAQDRETAAIVRAEERKAMGRWLMELPTVGIKELGEEPETGIVVPDGAIEALARGEAPAGWPEKE